VLYSIYVINDIGVLVTTMIPFAVRTNIPKTY